MRKIFMVFFIMFNYILIGQGLDPMLKNTKGFKEIQLTYKNLELSKFKKLDENSLDLNHKSSEFPYTWKEYYPLHNVLEKKLFYSPNKNLFIDIYSGSCYVEKNNTIACDSGGTPILLGNKTENKLSSIFLKSSSEKIIDVVWNGNEEVYLFKKWFFELPEFEIMKVDLLKKNITIYKLD